MFFARTVLCPLWCLREAGVAADPVGHVSRPIRFAFDERVSRFALRGLATAARRLSRCLAVVLPAEPAARVCGWRLTSRRRRMLYPRLTLALVLAWACLLPRFVVAETGQLRVCADPNNLPFSNARGEGFENRIIEVIARQLGEDVAYTWRAQRRGYVREALKGGLCDVIPGVATGSGMLATTRPYYRSSYVFLSRADRALDIASFDDPRLRTLRTGVQMIGDDAANAPPAHALSRRNIIENVRGYMIYGDYRSADPASPIIEAVTSGEIDVAVVWGPVAGYYARRQQVPLDLRPVSPISDGPTLPMAFDISMGVRREDADLRNALQAALAAQRPIIDAILADYGIPRLDPPRSSAPNPPR
jgi:quinoprotein dehydrogenase-associated probable ABC transporter substrate-binding protein